MPRLQNAMSEAPKTFHVWFDTNHERQQRLRGAFVCCEVRGELFAYTLLSKEYEQPLDDLIYLGVGRPLRLPDDWHPRDYSTELNKVHSFLEKEQKMTIDKDSNIYWVFERVRRVRYFSPDFQFNMNVLDDDDSPHTPYMLLDTGEVLWDVMVSRDRRGYAKQEKRGDVIFRGRGVYCGPK